MQTNNFAWRTLVEGNPTETISLPEQKSSNAKYVPMPWRQHVIFAIYVSNIMK